MSANPGNLYQAPRDDALEARSRQDLTWLFLSFEGRIPRSKYWFAGISAYLVFLGPVAGLAYYFLHVSRGQEAGTREAATTAEYALIAFGEVIAGSGMLWTGLAVSIKRWHDRGKSGWWSLIYLLPYVGGLWTVIELGFLSGTPGNNQYGPNPLDRR